MTMSDNIHYEFSSKAGGTGFGGMAAVLAFVKRIGLDTEINRRLTVFKKRCPCLNSLGAERIPDPTTAGDFCCRMIYGYRVSELDSQSLDRIEHP